MSKKRLGVVLFQLGGPDSSEAVEPFLYNLFCDPDIINFPGAFLARRPLARYISRRRAGVVREHYDAIGGHSPIRQLT
jgi:ferrochelatase